MAMFLRQFWTGLRPSIWPRFCVIIGLLVTAQWVNAGRSESPIDPPTLGMWYDPLHDGHGFDLQRQGDTWFLVFYTYDQQGEPIWYIATGELQGATLSMDLLRIGYDPNRTPPQQVDGVVGQVTLNFALQSEAPCSPQPGQDQAVFSWQIDDVSGQWCVQPLIVADGFPAQDFSGHWFAGDADQGWGMTFYFQGQDDDGQAAAQFILLYFYDGSGSPRWAIAVPEQPGAVSSATLETIGGYCTGCEPTPLLSQDSGLVSHQFALDDSTVQAMVSVDMEYPGAASGGWARDQSPLFLLSDPAPRLLPLPDTLDGSQPIAVVNTQVISMASDELLPHQTVVIEAGVITQLGHVSEVQVPDQAEVLDGRRRFVMPGLADMHTHLSVGGTQRAIDRSGLISILAGVTTSLNMGDGVAGGMAGVRDRWLSGQAIGPTLYLGKTAYGPNDNALRDYDALTPATIDTPLRAQQYAQSIANQGYDFIKVYNTLSVAVVNVLNTQGRVLGLPVIGHAPKNMSFADGLDAGQVMVAHIAEVYFTFFGNSMQSGLLESAAQVVQSRGVYQSATISTSEVFAGLYGGNQDNFDHYIQRAGAQYLDPAIHQFWQSAFNGSLYRPAGAQPGQLDARFEFFQDIVLAMQQGGVLLLGGSDAPAHPGLVPGFGLHQEIRVMQQAGLSLFEAFSSVTRNAGQFIDQTLAPEIPFGTVEQGKRADLLLLDENPLLDHKNLGTQKGLLLRGGWFSQQTLLDQLQTPAAKDKRAVVIDPWPHPHH